MEKHTPTPWRLETKENFHLVADDYNSIVGGIGFGGDGFTLTGYINKPDAELIVKAVNNHDKLVEALKRLLFTAPWNDSDEFSEAKSKARELLKHLESNPLTK